MSSDDITFCADADQCPSKSECRRAEKPRDPEYASYSDFWANKNLPKGIALKGCEYFLEIRK